MHEFRFGVNVGDDLVAHWRSFAGWSRVVQAMNGAG
jgi:hypothetical protein